MLSKRVRSKSRKKTKRLTKTKRSPIQETQFDYQDLEPRQLLATLGSTSELMIVNYDMATGTETYQAMPDLDFSLLQGGAVGFEPGTNDKAVSSPGMSGAQESVFGNDDRVLINDPHLNPYDEAGALRMQFADGTWSFCSGTMVGPYHFLTAGHCVHDGDWISQGTVSLGRDGDDRWYGSANVTNMVSVTGWTQNADPNHDWALIRLDRSLGDNVGWEGRWWWSTNGPLTGMDVSIAGYPGDLAGDTSQAARAADEHVVWMYESEGSMLAPSTNQLRYNNTLDTAGGMSGSGVIEDRSGVGRLVVGVHAYGNGGDGSNEATRMTQSISDIIADRLDTWAEPSDRADLVDWDSWFNNKDGDNQVSFMSTGEVLPGDSFSVTTYPRNNGTVPAPAYEVSFYASTNTTISTADYFLGTVSMGGLNEFTWDTSTLNISFPSDIPEGDYNIGWIIDSGADVTEFLEGNNTGYITDSQLSVVQPLPLTMNTAEGQAYFVNGSPAFSGANVNDSLSFDANLNFAGDVDSYYFSVDTSGVYEIRGSDFGNAVDPVIALYDAETGTRLALDDDSGLDDDGLISHSLTAWNRYVVAIGDWTESVFDQVSIQIVGSTSWFAQDIAIDADGNGSTRELLNTQADQDYFSFTVPADGLGTGTAVVAPLAGSGLNAHATLWDADGNLLQARDFAGVDGAETIVLNGLNPGDTYRLGVVSDDLLSSGIFDINIGLDIDPGIEEPSGIDFGPVGSNSYLDYPQVSNDAYNAGVGYGWTSQSGLLAFTEQRGNDLMRDKVGIRNGTFVIDVDNGTYDVGIVLGSVLKVDAITINVEGQNDQFTPMQGPAVVRWFQVDVTDGQLTMNFNGQPGLSNRFNIAGINLSEVGGRSIPGANDETPDPKSNENYWQDTSRVFVSKDPSMARTTLAAKLPDLSIGGSHKLQTSGETFDVEAWTPERDEVKADWLVEAFEEVLV